jgi:tetrahydromethanopterin S-methyltransferase subunit E
MMEMMKKPLVSFKNGQSLYRVRITQNDAITNFSILWLDYAKHHILMHPFPWLQFLEVKAETE